MGYGLAGRSFHAPLVASTDGLAVSHVVTADTHRRRQAAAEHPGARLVTRANELWEADPRPELVVVATPNDSHVELALAAIDQGIPVVVDKPLAVTALGAQELASRAEQAGVFFTVFHNRRWDTDQLTLRRLIAEDALGEVIRYESRFERWRPERNAGQWRELMPPEEGGGVLLDLGTHLVDQALVLFGSPTHVYAETFARRGGPSDDDVFIALRHATGTVSHLWASAVAPAPGPRLRVQGSAAGFLVTGLDPQEAALRAGRRPAGDDQWGLPPGFEHGRLIAGERSIPVRPEPGSWPLFYALVRDAILAGGPAPVDPRDAVKTLRVLEAARRSAGEGALIPL